MRIVFDLDGVICELKKPSESYSEVSPKKKVIQKMVQLKYIAIIISKQPKLNHKLNIQFYLIQWIRLLIINLPPKLQNGIFYCTYETLYDY